MTTYCKNHPQTETSLRCNRCDEPMCIQCAVHTPTGYRCKDCIKEQKKIFDTAEWYDYLSGFILATILSAIASAVVGFISNWFYGFGVLFFAPFAATIIVNASKMVTRRRRSRKLFITIAVGVVLGGAYYILQNIAGILFMISMSSNPVYAESLPVSIFLFLPLIWQIIYLFIATPAVYAGLSGFRIK